MLIIDGEAHGPRGYSCIDYRESKLEFRPGNGARTRHKTPIDLGVIHWTGGEGGAESVYRVLDARELASEFAMETDGDIYQFADPIRVDTYDVGPYNPRSFGIEIANYGFRDDPSEIPRAGRARPLYDCTIRGKPRKLAAFSDAQIRALVAWCDQMSELIPTVPRCLPGQNGRLFTGTMSRSQAARYSGWLGHFHLSASKSDPGTQPLEALLASGRFRLSEVGP